MKERGYWFRAVAGSSAGAITATLIAAGLTVDQLDKAVPVALRKVSKMYLGDLAWSPIVRVGRLRDWLEETLKQQLGVFGCEVSTSPVTFAQLYCATGIELYVVAMDVGTRQPIVFSAAMTPHIAVAPAVMASSAIPIAFWPGRLKCVHEDTTKVHRLMDGGVWANYPAFVFKDASFRAFHALEMPPRDSVTVGFLLESQAPAPPGRPVEIVTSRAGASTDVGVWSVYKLLGRAPIRLFLFTLAPLIVAVQALYTIERGGLLFLKDYGTRPGVPSVVTEVAGFLDGFTAGSTMKYFTLYPVIFGIVLLAVVLAVLGATVLDSGGPTLKTLMAVGTNVPYWVGHTEDDHVVRLTVPQGLDTTRFRLPQDKVSTWVGAAHGEAETALDGIHALPRIQ